ncbi:MAG: ATP synthase F1 subunit epsilon [Candidatus Binatia bacterium]
MATAFQLRIVTPSRQLLDEEVREVTGPGTLGEFGVLPDHITFLTSLEIGTLSFRSDRGVQRLAVRGGFAEVANNVMTVLADDAVFSEDIDPAAARSDLHTAEAQVKDLSPLDDAYLTADAARRWAQARLEVAGR